MTHMTDEYPKPEFVDGSNMCPNCEMPTPSYHEGLCDTCENDEPTRLEYYRYLDRKREQGWNEYYARLEDDSRDDFTSDHQEDEP